MISPVVEWLAVLSREFRTLQAGAVNCRLAGKPRLQDDVSVDRRAYAPPRPLRNRRNTPIVNTQTSKVLILTSHNGRGLYTCIIIHQSTPLFSRLARLYKLL